MTFVKEMWFLDHFDWYTHVKGVGYVPTDKAPPAAVEDMKKLNDYIEKKYPKREITSV